MARPRKQEQRRGEIVAATARLLVDRGMAAARLTDIAKEMGVTPASISYYYPDLIDLYAAAYETATTEYTELRRARVEESVGARERLLACLQLGIPERGSESFDATLLLMELSAVGTREPRFGVAEAEFARVQLELLEQLIAEGQAAGEFRPRFPAAHTARMLLSAEDGIAPSVILELTSSEEAVRMMSELAGLLLDCELAPREDGGR
ncbi:TetR/AcrR family transcriptional regulator [Leucobacter sp. 7(1)]|uniref:TetR/AcrR family transcriptional regulator n=1 Tax=Leucobacter sp. 7(1) TaxID=1255613 RepID=UPI0015961B39|nr:TetR family transcriptional regulator [Leucobacter sp. 7(1)]